MSRREQAFVATISGGSGWAMFSPRHPGGGFITHELPNGWWYTRFGSEFLAHAAVKFFDNRQPTDSKEHGA